jgi:hypothetical protein
LVYIEVLGGSESCAIKANVSFSLFGSVLLDDGDTPSGL